MIIDKRALRPEADKVEQVFFDTGNQIGVMVTWIVGGQKIRHAHRWGVDEFNRKDCFEHFQKIASEIAANGRPSAS